MNHATIYGWEKGLAFPATLARFGSWCHIYDLTVSLIIKRKDGSVIYSKDL